MRVYDAENKVWVNVVIKGVVEEFALLSHGQYIHGKN